MPKLKQTPKKDGTIVIRLVRKGAKGYEPEGGWLRVSIYKGRELTFLYC